MLYILASLVVKELNQLRRDVKALVMILFMPLIVALMFGYGYGGRMGRLPIAVVNLDGGDLAWLLVDTLRNSQAYEVAVYASSVEEGVAMIREERVYAVVVIPSSFTERLLRQRKVSVEVIVDESNPTFAEMLRQGISYVIQMFQDRMSELYGTPNISVTYATVFGPKVSRIENFTPVILSVLLHLVPMSIMSVSIAREREKGTFEYLIVTPISKWLLIAGKLVAYFIATLFDMFLTLLVITMLFDVHVRGSLGALLVLSGVFLMCSLTIGMLISTLSKNQLQAHQASIFFFIPSLFFSGIMTPVKLLREDVRVVSYLLPMYYYLKGARNIMIKGFTLYDVAYEVLALCGFTVASFIASALLLRMRVE